MFKFAFRFFNRSGPIILTVFSRSRCLLIHLTVGAFFFRLFFFIFSKSKSKSKFSKILLMKVTRKLTHNALGTKTKTRIII